MSDPTLKLSPDSPFEADPWPKICGILAIACGTAMLLIFQIPGLFRTLSDEGHASWNIVEILLKWPPYLIRDILLILGGLALIRQQRKGYFLVISMAVFHWVTNIIFLFYSTFIYGVDFGIFQQLLSMLGLEFPPRLHTLPTILMNVSTIIWAVFLFRDSVRNRLTVSSGHTMGAVGLGIGLSLYAFITWIVWEAIKPDPYIYYEF